MPIFPRVYSVLLCQALAETNSFHCFWVSGWFCLCRRRLISVVSAQWHTLPTQRLTLNAPVKLLNFAGSYSYRCSLRTLWHWVSLLTVFILRRLETSQKCLCVTCACSHKREVRTSPRAGHVSASRSHWLLKERTA